MNRDECVRFAARVNLESGCDRFTIAQFEEDSVFLDWHADDEFHRLKIGVRVPDIPQLRMRLQELGFDIRETFEHR